VTTASTGTTSTINYYEDETSAASLNRDATDSMASTSTNTREGGGSLDELDMIVLLVFLPEWIA
jgi:hypothetical protein